jgi:CyaY protein
MSQLSESDYNRLVDETLLAIEEAVDESGAEIDYENTGGVLTLSFEDGSQVILNRQTPLRQLWLAARRGGFHFDQRDGEWVLDSDGTPLATVLNDVAGEQAGQPLHLL